MSKLIIDPFLAVLYDGTTSPSDFERNFAILSLYQSWNEDVQFANIKHFLKGKALRVCEGATTATTVALIMTALKTACAPSKELLLNNFYARRRKSDESISNFASDLQSLAALAFPGLTVDQTDGILRVQLIASLPEQVKPIVSFNRTLGWDDLIGCLDSAYSSNETGRGGANLIENIKTEASDINYAAAARSNTSSSFNRFNGNCHFCNKFGHRQAQCRLMQQQFSNNSNSSINKSNNSFNNSPRNNLRNESFNQRTRSPPPVRRDTRPQFGFNSREQNNYNINSGVDPDRQWNSSSYHNGRDQSFGLQRFKSTTMNNEACEETDANIDNRESDLKRIHSSSNFIMANSSSQRFQEFPFLADSNMVEIMLTNAYIDETRADLLKIPIKLKTLDGKEREFSALVDGGSTHSFLAIRILSNLERISLDADTTCHANFSITGATGVVKDKCYLMEASIGIQNWNGPARLVVSHAVQKHDIVLGRDFLSANKAIVDHGNDTLNLGGMLIQIMTTESIEHGFWQIPLQEDLSDNPITKSLNSKPTVH